LRHRDASQGERRRVLAQPDALQCANGITSRQSSRGGRDQPGHRNPVTLVTLTRSISTLKVYRKSNIHEVANTNEGEIKMTTHTTGTRKEWLAARLELLEAEKDLTRRSDEVARKRQELPWVRVDKEYRFETDAGSASLADLFGGRSQLLIYHFMFGPDYEAGCPACSSIPDGIDGVRLHLPNHRASPAAEQA